LGENFWIKLTAREFVVRGTVSRTPELEYYGLYPTWSKSDYVRRS